MYTHGSVHMGIICKLNLLFDSNGKACHAFRESTDIICERIG